MIHEGSHAFDAALELTSGNKEFQAIFAKERVNLYEDDSVAVYRTSYIEEFFAVAMEEYFCGGETLERFKGWYPLTYKYIHERLESQANAHGRST